ncbi:MAG: NUDIX hydrolase [candidate division Zixibacteria bacterium]|nr:NUDIX hydrolase [candidate division Zixibacteria bacterium]
MSFISPDDVAAWEERYGAPKRWTHNQPVTPEDYAGIKASQKRGRAHDVTMYIEGDGRIAVIAKPFYPPGMYRPPSGGLDPGEPLEDGATREAYEETGLRVRLESYILRADVVFADGDNTIAWTTHIFTASTDNRLITPIDRKEIREARWADPAEFARFGELMRQSPRGGLRYRATLHERVAAIHPLFLSLA